MRDTHDTFCVSGLPEGNDAVHSGSHHYSLGRKLAELNVHTGVSAADGAFRGQNPVTGKFEIMDVGLPFRAWSDALPRSAKTTLAKSNIKEANPADTLEIKYYIMK